VVGCGCCIGILVLIWNCLIIVIVACNIIFSIIFMNISTVTILIRMQTNFRLDIYILTHNIAINPTPIFLDINNMFLIELARIIPQLILSLATNTYTNKLISRPKSQSLLRLGHRHVELILFMCYCY
jgi:hypothetical protein